MFFKKKQQDPPPGVSPEDYRNIRVMRDDLDELSGKKVPKAETSPIPEPVNQAHEDNPFLGNAGSSEPTPSIPKPVPEIRTVPVSTPDVQIIPVVQVAPKKETPNPSSAGPSDPARFNVGKWLIPAGITIVALIASVVIFMFFFSNFGNQQKEIASDTAPAKNENNTEAAPETPLPPKENVESFSISSPNYLQIDTESAAVTPDGVAATLEETAGKVGAMTTSPVEFLVRDTNNNPIAFSRFAHLLGLKLSEETLSSVDESFSLYFVPENGIVRRAIVIQAKDAGTLETSIRKDESTLPASFGTLLYGKNISVPATVTFRDGSFSALQTRFVVIDSATGRSFDHILFGKRWIIGTSKDSFRAVLGKIVQEQSKN